MSSYWSLNVMYPSYGCKLISDRSFLDLQVFKSSGLFLTNPESERRDDFRIGSGKIYNAKNAETLLTAALALRNGQAPVLLSQHVGLSLYCKGGIDSSRYS